MTAEGHDDRLLARVLEDSDNVEPCASSAAAGNLLRLARLTGRDELRAEGEKILERFGGLLEERPVSLAHMLGALETGLMPAEELVVTGSGGALLAEARRRFRPQRALLDLSDDKRAALASLAPWTRDVPSRPAPRAYLCKARACGAPIEGVAALREALGSR
jgi:hypothetical protein